MSTNKTGKKIRDKNSPSSLIDMEAIQRPNPQYPQNNPLLNDMSSLNAVTFPIGFSQDFPSTGGMIRTGLSNKAQTIPPQLSQNQSQFFGKKIKSPQMFSSPNETGGIGHQSRHAISPTNLNQQLTAARQSPPNNKVPDTIEQIRETPTQGFEMNADVAGEEATSSILQTAQDLNKSLSKKEKNQKKSIESIGEHVKKLSGSSVESIPQSMVSKVMKSQIMQEQQQQQDEQGNRIKVVYQDLPITPVEDDVNKKLNGD